MWVVHALPFVLVHADGGVKILGDRLHGDTANVFYGGTVSSPVHMDMVLYRPTVLLDDRVIVEGGVVML